MYQQTVIDRDTIARIDVVYFDGVTESVMTKDGEDVSDLQARVDANYSDSFYNDELEAIMAYDNDNTFIASRTAEEFFALQEGF